MITALNEFETIPAFTVVAGSSFGGVSNREFCADILRAVDTVTGYEETYQHWVDLAECSDDDDYVANGDCINDAMQLFNDNITTMPEFCSLVLFDNEARVLPDIESAIEECEVFEDYPEKYHGDFIAVVNDHGNTTCQRWDGSKYVTIWDMV